MVPKPGEKIVCLKPSGNLKLYGVYEVAKISAPVEVCVQFEGSVEQVGDNIWYLLRDFYVPNNFIPGQEVVCINTVSTLPLKVGNKYIVTGGEAGPNGSLVRVKDLSNGLCISNGFYLWRFIPVELYKDSNVCPDCNGTGVYVGLVVVEACRTCKGRILPAHALDGGSRTV